MTSEVIHLWLSPVFGIAVTRGGRSQAQASAFIWFDPHLVRSFRIHQLWKSAPVSCLPDQLYMGMTHSCPTEMPFEDTCLH